MPSEYDALLEPSPVQQKSVYDALLEPALKPEQQGGKTSLGQKIAIGAATGIRVAGGLGTAPLEVLDITPPTLAARAGIGAAIGAGTDIVAQGIEKLAGVRQKFSPAETGVAAGLMAIPLGELPRIGRAAQIGYRALQGAALGAGATQATSILETGKPASLKETVYGGAIGGAFTGAGEFIAPKLQHIAFGKPESEIPVTEQAAAEVRPKEVTTDASKITGAKSVPVPEVRQEVGGEAPLRQQGQTAEARQEIAPQEVAPVPQPEQPTHTSQVSTAPPDARTFIADRVSKGVTREQALSEWRDAVREHDVKMQRALPTGSRVKTDNGVFELESDGIWRATEGGGGTGVLLGHPEGEIIRVGSGVEGRTLPRGAGQELSPVSKAGQAPAVSTLPEQQPRIISTAINTPEGIKRGIKWNQPHDEIGQGITPAAETPTTMGEVTPRGQATVPTWREIPSVTPGGKKSFFVADTAEGKRWVVWDRFKQTWTVQGEQQIPSPENPQGRAPILAEVKSAAEGKKWVESRQAASVETARPSPTQETGRITPEYEHLKKGIANWYDPNATINAFGKVNDDGSISIPVQRFGVASTDATRGGTWYELNKGGVSDYNALPETGAARLVGNVATKYGVGGKERVESEITTKNPFLVNATRLHEGQYPLELAKKVLSKEEFGKAKRGITGANAEKAYSRLEKLTSQKLQEQGHDAVIFYHKYEYGSIPHQIFKLPAEAGAGTKIAVTTEPIAGAGVPRESVAASAKPPSVPEGGTRDIGGAAAPQGIPEEQKGFLVQDPDGTQRFAGREEAARIANAAGQVRPENAGTTELHSQQLQEAPAAEAPPAAMTPEPPQTAEALGEALSEKPRLAGPSNRVLQERAARGEIPQAPESGTGVLKEDLVRRANEQYTPERAKLAGDRAMRGRSTLDEDAIIVLHDEKLSKIAADAERAMKANPTDVSLQQAYQTARNAMSDWQYGPLKALHAKFHGEGINLQGATNVDTGTLVGLQKYAWETAKRDFTPQEIPIMNEAADRVRIAEVEEKASIVKANDAVQKVLKPSRYMDLKQLQESLSETLKTMTC